MSKPIRLPALLSIALLGGCAAAPPPVRAPETSADPSPLAERLARLRTLLVERNLDEADRVFASLPALVGSDLEAAAKADYWGATLRAYHHDLAGATRILEHVGAAAHTRGDFEAEGMAANSLTWVRWAAGDLPGALAANAGMFAAVAHTTDADTKHGLELHATWDRAYLLLDVAMVAPPERRVAALADATAARAGYERITKHPDDDDGLAVLAAYFAWRAGDFAAAAESARRVDLQNDGDVQDLWIVRLALEAAGDAPGATAVAARMHRAAYLMVPLIEIFEAARQVP